MRIETHGGAGHARRPRRSKVYVKTIGDKTSMKIMMIPGFSWAKSVGPKLPKLPDGSCPARRPRPKLCDGAEHCTVTPRRPGARRRTSATRPKAPARSSSRTARRPRSTRGAASSKPLRLLLDGVWGVLEPSESRVHLHAIDATSARSRGIYNTRRPRDALIDVLRRPATATSWTSRTCRRSSATRRSSCTSSRSR